MHHPKHKNTSNAAFHRSASPSSREEAELIEKCGKALSDATDPLERLRLLCLSCGAGGIMRLGRILRRLDVEGNRRLSKKVFLDGILETGLGITQEEADKLFTRFDPDGTGVLNLDEFLRELRPPMSDNRRAIVEQVFRKLDQSGTGTITTDDLRKAYSVKSYNRYMSGEETAEAVLDKFLANFAAEGTPEGVITLEEFMDFYNGIGLSVDNDCYFDLMMRQDYKL